MGVAKPDCDFCCLKAAILINTSIGILVCIPTIHTFTDIIPGAFWCHRQRRWLHYWCHFHSTMHVFFHSSPDVACLPMYIGVVIWFALAGEMIANLTQKLTMCSCDVIWPLFSCLGNWPWRDHMKDGGWEDGGSSCSCSMGAKRTARANLSPVYAEEPSATNPHPEP